MKLQFSLATLLGCTAVLAVVITICIAVPVSDFTGNWTIYTDVATGTHSATGLDLVWRLAWAGPLSIAATFAALWIVQKVKSRVNHPESKQSN